VEVLTETRQLIAFRFRAYGSPAGFASEVGVMQHLSGANYLFVDGHAQFLKWSLLQNELKQTGSRLVNPEGKP
jgi:prepilin-type processing-associated H-X9-DG protein